MEMETSNSSASSCKAQKTSARSLASEASDSAAPSSPKPASQRKCCHHSSGSHHNSQRNNSGSNSASSNSGQNPSTTTAPTATMTASSGNVPSGLPVNEMQQKTRSIVPKLTGDLYKGQCGRIGVFGGCIMYTGAPYFAAISALKAGADLVHVFCEHDAGQVIKSYSPELIVHPILDTEYVLEEIDQWLPRLHAVVIGPGLGRNQSMLARISIVIDRCKALNMPMVIDADGLWHLTNNPLVIKGYKRAVLTPNANEFSRLVHSVLKRGDVSPSVHPDPQLVAEVSRALGGVTVVHKGSTDFISNGKFTEECSADGCPRRCGGQGDLLSGTLALFLYWATRNHIECPDPGPGVIAGWAASRLSRACAVQAFSKHGRATTTSDLIEEIESAFSRLYESETSL